VPAKRQLEIALYLLLDGVRVTVWVRIRAVAFGLGRLGQDKREAGPKKVPRQNNKSRQTKTRERTKTRQDEYEDMA
jgi:hypothetical protein